MDGHQKRLAVKNFKRFFPVPQEAFLDRSLKRADLGVLGYLNGWWHTTGTAEPSIRRICQATGYSRSTVKAAIRQLVASKWIQRLYQSSEKTGLNLSTMYLPGRKYHIFQGGEPSARGQNVRPLIDHTTPTNSDRWFHEDGTLKPGGSIDQIPRST